LEKQLDEQKFPALGGEKIQIKFGRNNWRELKQKSQTREGKRKW